MSWYPGGMNQISFRLALMADNGDHATRSWMIAGRRSANTWPEQLVGIDRNLDEVAPWIRSDKEKKLLRAPGYQPDIEK